MNGAPCRPTLPVRALRFVTRRRPSRRARSPPTDTTHSLRGIAMIDARAAMLHAEGRIGKSKG